jgi:glycosyltransferase involved in cell wall biosynthesis
MSAYSLLSEKVREAHPLVIAGLHSKSVQKIARDRAEKLHIQVSLPELLSDDEMRKMYESARIVVIPSLAEGLSMPAIEGWSAGTVAVGSRGTVLEEVIGSEELLFDPYSPEDMSNVMNRLLTNDALWVRMLKISVKRLEIYNWDLVAQSLLKVINS